MHEGKQMVMKTVMKTVRQNTCRCTLAKAGSIIGRNDDGLVEPAWCLPAAADVCG
jgi:hypothetical protein